MRIRIMVMALATAVLAGESMEARVDGLIDRYRDGDEAARTGVIAETQALGELAVAELYRRLVDSVQDQPAGDPGVVMTSEHDTRRSDRVITLDFGFLRPQGEVDADTCLLGPAQIAALEGKVESLSAPRLTVYDGQRANISILDQKTYVRTRAPGGEPVTGTVRSGLVLEVRAGIVGDGVSLELRWVAARLREPLARIDTDRGFVELPEVMKRETAVTLDLESGGRRVLLVRNWADGKPMLLDMRATVTTFD
jgi:hypothetical protein